MLRYLHLFIGTLRRAERPRRELLWERTWRCASDSPSISGRRVGLAAVAQSNVGCHDPNRA